MVIILKADSNRFELWRQDDNGRRFLAEQRLAELCRGLHEQTDWVSETTGGHGSGL